MDLRGDPRVRAGVIPDDEEEEEFQDSREDQPNQLPVSNLIPPPASDLSSLAQASWVIQVHLLRVRTNL